MRVSTALSLLWRVGVSDLLKCDPIETLETPILELAALANVNTGTM
jgi:hypothetical protein